MEIQTAQGPLTFVPHKRTEAAPVGHNNPPASPYDAIKAHVDDLYDEATNFLDGEPIANQEQADAVSKILDEARKARTAAEAQRKLEAKPFDDGKAAVQALWTPITDEKKGRCALIVETCQKTLAPWLIALKAEQQRAADALRQEAEEKASAAREAVSQAGNDLSAREAAEALLTAASEADKQATRAGKAKAHAKGGERAIGLRTYYRAEIVNETEFARWVWANRHSEMTGFLQELADRESRGGDKAIPGLKVHEERKAV